ncbi:NHL domain-containing protein [Spirosoma jeollabukense]
MPIKLLHRPLVALLLVLSGWLLTALAHCGWAQTINTFAGKESENVPATTAHLAFPNRVTVDGSGNLYIADTDNNRIRKVSPLGLITTVAGTGIQGYTGDGGPATAAQLNTPVGLALDGSGNLYVTDTYNHRIRKINPAGMIATVAGTGILGFSGDGGEATSARLFSPYGVAVDGSGNLYIAYTGNHCIRQVNPAGTIATVVGTGIQGFSGDGDWPEMRS